MNTSTEKTDRQYLEFAESIKISAPGGLEESVLSFIGNKKTARKRFIAGISSGAVLVLLLIVTLVFSPGKSPELEYGEKLSTLVEAYKLFPEEESGIDDDDILYEDESIIIYMK